MERVADFLGLGVLSFDFSPVCSIHVHRNGLEPSTALQAQLFEGRPNLLPAATKNGPEHFLPVWSGKPSRIERDGSPIQFRGVNGWVVAMSQKYWNIANPVSTKPELIAEGNSSKGGRPG